MNPILTYKEPLTQPSPHPRLDSFKIAKVEDDLEIEKSDYCKNVSTTTCTGDGLYPPTTLFVALS
jgi:hypothetical protein